MSTKIYAGLISSAFLTLDEVCAMQREMLKSFSKKAEKMIIAYLVETVIHKYTRHRYKLDKTEYCISDKYAGKSAVDIAYIWLSEGREDICSGFRQPNLDFSFEVVIIPHPNGKQTLVLPFCEHAEWVQLLKEKLNLQEYGYWDNTDKPEETTGLEWKARKQAWKKALNGFSNPPSESGITLQLCHSRYNEWWVPETPALIKYVLTTANSVKGRKQIAARLAREIDQNAYFNAQELDGRPLSATLRAIQQWREDLKTTEGTIRLNALTNTILEELPVLTEQDITSILPTIQPQGGSVLQGGGECQKGVNK